MDGLSDNREYYRSRSDRMAGFKLWNMEKFTLVEIPITFFRFCDFILQNKSVTKLKECYGLFLFY